MMALGRYKEQNSGTGNYLGGEWGLAEGFVVKGLKELSEDLYRNIHLSIKISIP